MHPPITVKGLIEQAARHAEAHRVMRQEAHEATARSAPVERAGQPQTASTTGEPPK